MTRAASSTRPAPGCGELKSNIDIYFGTFDSEEACKAVRAQIRATLGSQEEATRSDCFESRDSAGATDS